MPIRIADFAAGLLTIEVACAGPRYAALHVAFEDEGLAPLLVPLDVAAPQRYRKTFSLIDQAHQAWIELMPASGPGDVLSIAVGPVRWRDLAALGWRAARRHARSPRAFLAKACQVAARGGSMAFTDTAADGSVDAATYRNWQEAFESEHETRRIVTAFDRQIGRRPVRVLAVIAAWEHGPEALREVLNSLAGARGTQVGVLSLTAEDPRDALRGEAVTASWEHHACGHAADLPMGAVARAAERAGADLVLFLERPGRFHELSVTCFALALEFDPAARAVYADHDRLDAAGCRRDPVFKPAWSPDYEAAWDYVAQPAAFRADPRALAEMGTLGWAQCPSFSLLMHISNGQCEAAVRHVPRVLFHERLSEADRPSAVRQAAEKRMVEEVLGKEIAVGGPAGPRRVRHAARGANPRASVIIPSKDNPDWLARACRSVTAASYAPVEIVIVDNGSASEAQLRLLSDLAAGSGVRVVSDPRPFNFSRLVNLGRVHSRGEILILLNDDVEALDGEWLSELASNANRHEIGCVGALLHYPDGRVQHGGVVLGINGSAGHAFRYAKESEGVGFRLKVAHEVTAVTAACLAVRADVFDAAGGFAEDLPVTLNDVDFCLKVRERGYRNLFTPHARLIHRESTSRGLDVTPERLRRLSQETAIFHRRWGEAALVDPFYSPHLSLSHEDFRPRAL